MCEETGARKLELAPPLGPRATEAAGTGEPEDQSENRGAEGAEPSEEALSRRVERAGRR